MPCAGHRFMPAPLTAQLIALYLSKRRSSSRQEVAAAAAGISVSSAHRIDSGRLQPRAAKPRGRRRPDPLVVDWEPLLLPLLERHPVLTPATLLEHLQERKLDQDWSSLKRTLQRRVQHWKALHGPAPEMMFPLAYQPGEIGFCDFTKVKPVEITLRGEPFPHLLFHDRLAWSGWAYGQVIHGGESFVALSEGLENAMAACGGVPQMLATDRLSAASRNRDGSYALDITPRYQAHYGLSPSRNNRGVAHENDIVEAPHGHVKRRLEQKLILRGSCDFEEPAEYGELLSEVFNALNAPRQRRYEQELEHLAPLPAFRFADDEPLTVRVRSTSTIEVRQVIYSVPLTLIGRQVTVRLHHDRLVVFLGSDWVCQLPRAYGVAGEKRAWCIDLEHLIDGLRAKPRALLHCRYQRHIFPDQRWWDLWQQLLAGADRDGAARVMVEALYVAVRVASFALVLAFLEQVQRRQTLSLSALQQRFRVPPRCKSLPDPVIPQHLLATYDHLVPIAALSGGGSGTATAAQTAETGAIPQPLAAAGPAG
ncbi:MAG: IS21 family transposase [Prochlorococcaceae cyanobacterium]